MGSAEQRIAERYEVLELLGQGGMGAVYRVRDDRTRREVALKRLTRRDGDGGRVAIELFEREFHTLSELAHPRIIEVYEYGVDDQGAYYTMELLGGQDLRELGKLPWKHAAELLLDVASSLAILHSRRLLHGDVSPRNVRCTADGRAKLLDFGAMMPMGVAKRLVGTPPFMAPEMVNAQTLDARTDLFALGALAYGMVTGRHAYPASDVRQLRDYWRRPLVAPAALESQVPAALSDLVLELLQLSQGARPRSAAIVMERLCSIASLPLEEAPDVARAYLVTPTLVGREEQLKLVRERVMAAARSAGGVLIASGAGGAGRSRFLDACVLEGKLLGFQVVRADRSDADSGNFGVAAAICRRLFELAPSAAAAAAQLHAPILAHVVGFELMGARAVQPAPDRRQTLAALRDFTLSLTRALRLMIAVDDADRIDDVSVSLLSALAQKAKSRALCLVLTTEADSEGSAALDLLAEGAERIQLPLLSEAQTERLMQAVFGDSPNLVMVARRIHAVSQGNPRAIMQLAEHLVDQRIARYAAGSFLLPERLTEAAMPASLSAAFAKRLSKLSADALELARVLSLTEPSELPVSKYLELTAHGDKVRTYRALDELVRAQILEAEGERYRVSSPTWYGVLQAQLGDDDRIAMHARLARAFEETGTTPRRTHHLMESGQPEPAIRLLLAQYLKDPNEPRDPLEDYVPGLPDQLERAAAAADTLQLPPQLRIELRMKACGAAQFLGDVARFMRLAPATVEQLDRESGLAEYRSLDPTLDPMARLTQAFERVQARYDATPPEQRGLAPLEAIRELSRICSMHGAVATGALDVRIIDATPSLEPLCVLSPAIALIEQTVRGMRALLQGRDALASELILGNIRRLEQPDGAGLGQLYRKSLHLGALYLLGLMDAGLGKPDAMRRLAALETEPGHRVNAQRVAMVVQLMQGEADGARAARRRSELMMLQDGAQQRYPATTLRPELTAYWLSDDLEGLKSCSERAARVAEQNPGWTPIMHLARCLYSLRQGDYAGAHAAIEQARSMVEPLTHRDWASISAAHVHVLVGLGRAGEAITLGEASMQKCRELGLGGYSRCATATAEAYLAAGRAQDAAELSDALIAQAQADGVEGLALGVLYEARARAAMLLDDEPRFHELYEKCTRAYQTARNPALAARVQRMFRDAGARALAQLGETPSGAMGGVSTALPLASVHQQLIECDGSEARAACVLRLLEQHAPSERSYLYLLRDGQLSFACASEDSPPPTPELQTAVEQVVACELSTPLTGTSAFTSASLSTSTSASVSPLSTVSSLVVPGSMQRLYPIVLAARSGGAMMIAGVAVLGLQDPVAPLPAHALVDLLASALLEQDDLDPATSMLDG